MYAVCLAGDCDLFSSELHAARKQILNDGVRSFIVDLSPTAIVSPDIDLTRSGLLMHSTLPDDPRGERGLPAALARFVSDPSFIGVLLVCSPADAKAYRDALSDRQPKRPICICAPCDMNRFSRLHVGGRSVQRFSQPRSLADLCSDFLGQLEIRRRHGGMLPRASTVVSPGVKQCFEYLRLACRGSLSLSSLDDTADVQSLRLAEIREVGMIDVWLELTMTDVCDFLFAGAYPCDEHRLSPGVTGTRPIVIVPGEVDRVRTHNPHERFAGRSIGSDGRHNVVQLSPDEGRHVGQWLGRRLREGDRRVRFLIPSRVSDFGDDRNARRFTHALAAGIATGSGGNRQRLTIKESQFDINDDRFADELAIECAWAIGSLPGIPRPRARDRVRPSGTAKRPPVDGP